MSSFPTRPLGACAKLLSGGTPRKTNRELWGGPLPWLTPKDMARWSGVTEETVATAAVGRGTRLAPPRTSFVAVRGMSLHSEIRVIFSEEPLTFNQDIKGIVANDDVDPEFLYFAIVAGKRQLLEWVSAAGHGTGVLDTSRLLSLPIPDVPLPTQRALAAIFADLDHKIDLNRRMAETLEATAEAIFRDWFIDFGPVRRKVAGESDPMIVMGGLAPDPSHAGELATLFPKSLTPAGLPEGWRERAIGELVDPLGGSTPSTADERFWVPADYRWATPKDLSALSDLALFETGRRVSAAGLAKITSGLLPPGTVLLSSRAPIGYLAIAQEPVAINQGFIALQPSPDVGSAYLYLWCKAHLDAIVANANGSTFQEISKKNFRPITSAVPDDFSVIRAFGELTQPLIDRIVTAAREVAALNEAREYLLPRLISGQIRPALSERA